MKYVFDHHDINPELFQVKFNKKGMLYKAVTLFERWSFKVADYSIATNESFKEIAINRAGMDAEKIKVVRSAPPAERFKIAPGKPEFKKGKSFLVGYLGIIGEQDGLDILMQTIKVLKDRNVDVHFAIIGGGTELANVKKLAAELAIDNDVDFYGIIYDDGEINDILNACDVCVNPDVPSEYNNLITTNKVMEYMSLKKPIVQFDLKEAHYSAGDSSLYASSDDIQDFADKINFLLENLKIRVGMGERGYNRFTKELSWESEKEKLVDLYEELFASTQ
ncbi:MAG TPA: glycosyltransferase WbuB [Flavobacteriales bacterium]|nr:glycosyltransferase WbuB [Flavobacteriales bacterium]